MRNIVLMIGVLLLGSMNVCLAANHPPTLKRFQDNAQIVVSLSRVDTNRLAVADDQISELTYPVGFCSDKKGDDGDTYLNVNIDHPFTLYVSTKNGHHFSLLVNPKAVVGKTLVFKPLSDSKKAAFWEASERYQVLLIHFMRDLINQKNPTGYARQTITHPTTYRLFNDVSVTPTRLYQGDHLQGVVYRLQNQSNKTLRFNPNEFAADGIRAVALSATHLKPMGILYVYEVRSNFGVPA